jgi:hypothetical protein
MTYFTYIYVYIHTHIYIYIYSVHIHNSYAYILYIRVKSVRFLFQEYQNIRAINVAIDIFLKLLDKINEFKIITMKFQIWFHILKLNIK